LTGGDANIARGKADAGIADVKVDHVKSFEESLTAPEPADRAVAPTEPSSHPPPAAAPRAGRRKRATAASAAPIIAPPSLPVTSSNASMPAASPDAALHLPAYADAPASPLATERTAFDFAPDLPLSTKGGPEPPLGAALGNVNPVWAPQFSGAAITNGFPSKSAENLLHPAQKSTPCPHDAAGPPGAGLAEFPAAEGSITPCAQR
jgi:hypothetical protein